MSTLAVKALNQSYGGSHTLWDVDLVVPKGSRTCLMGRNGMGKTTLLKCVMGLLRVTSGEMTFDETSLTGLPAEARARLGIGYVPQGREIFAQLTVEENLRVGLGIRKNGARTIPPKIFELFPVLKQMLNRRGGDLSGGQQQQLAIGRALVLEPSLLILDEPTEGIQPNIVHEIGDVILELNRGGRDGPPGRAEAAVRPPCRQRVPNPRKRPLRRRRHDRRAHRRRGSGAPFGVITQRRDCGLRKGGSDRTRDSCAISQRARRDL